MSNLNKMKKCELINYCKELEKIKKENRYFSDLIKEVKEDYEGLKKENEEITNKYNEGYDLLCKTKTNMEEMLDKIEELKEENEELKFKVNLDKDKIENYDNLDFKIYKYNEDTIKKLKKENEEIKINTMKCCKDLGNKNEKLKGYITIKGNTETIKIKNKITK